MSRKSFRFLVILMLPVFLLSSFTPVFAAGTVTNFVFDPTLDISYFSNYQIKADITGNPTSVVADVSGINGDGGSYWNYYADGSTYSTTYTKNLTYDSGSGKWISEDVRPDQIYPEVFFAPNDITWNNAPSDTPIRRGNYQLMHFTNPFTMTDSASFFVEFNVNPNGSNSQNLQVYLVEKGHDINYFNSNWTANPGVELVGTVIRTDPVHHTHTVNSSHRLVALATNADATVGTKSLDISGDFWIVLYNNAPAVPLGWSLRYQTSSLCNNTNGWYSGNATGWTTASQAGCPDAHIHLARRAAGTLDGAKATVTATYSDGSDDLTRSFYFNELPNLPPNATSFMTPIVGSVYTANSISVQWDPASDPNLGDTLTYKIYSYDGVTRNKIYENTGTSFSWDVTGVANDDYILEGEVCDQEPLCADFVMNGYFTINKGATTYSLSSISIESNNANPVLADLGDAVTLSFTAGGDITAASVNFYSGGQAITDTPEVSHVGNDWTASYVTNENDSNGVVEFEISSSNLDLAYNETTDNSMVTYYSTSSEGFGAGIQLNVNQNIINENAATDITLSWTSSSAVFLSGDKIEFFIYDSSNLLINETPSNATLADTDLDNNAKVDGSFGFLPGFATYTVNSPADVSSTNFSLSFKLPALAADNYSIAIVDDRHGNHGVVLIYVGGENEINITADVGPQLNFVIRTADDTNNLGADNIHTMGSPIAETSNLCDLGNLNLTMVASCSYRIKISTNASSGYTVQINSDGDLRKTGSGDVADIDDIDVVGENLVSVGTESYGISLNAGSATNGVITEAGNFATEDSSVPINSATDLYSSTGPNGPPATSVIYTALVTHKVAISEKTAAGYYSQLVTYTVTAIF